MKEYLGLGVVFSAVDKGLARSLKLTAQSLDDVDKKLSSTEKTANAGGKKGGIFSGVAEGLKMLSISHIGSTLNDMQEAMSGVGGGIEDTFKKLDTLRTKLTFTFDGKQAQNLNNALLMTKHNLGLTGDETEVMAQSMMEFGRTTDEAIKSLPMMGTLVGTLGLEAAKVSQMYGQGLATLRATPQALDGLMKEVVAIQKAYHLTDQISQLPEIFETVTKNSAMFGKVNAATALNTVRSISGLSAVFQKVGLSQSGALKAATGFADKLSSMKRSVADMRAGLAPLDEDLYEAANTLTLMGYNGEQAFQKMFEGADDPMKLAKELNGQFMTLSKEQQDIVAARFRRTFGDEATNLLQGYGDEAKKALSVDTPKKAKADKTFDEYTKAMTGTVDVQERLTNAAKEHMELMTSFANKDQTIKVLQAQREGWDNLTKAVTDADSILGKVLKTLALFKDLGLAGFFTQLAPFGILLGLLTPLIFPLTNLVSLFKIFGKIPIAIIGKSFKILSAALGTTGMGFKAILKPMKLLAGIAEHLYVSIGVKLINAFSFITKALRFLTSGIGSLIRLAFGPLLTVIRAVALAISLTPIGWITAAIVGLGLAIAGVIYYWEDIKKAAMSFFEYITPALEAVNKWMKSLFGIEGDWDLGKRLGLDQVMSTLSNVWLSIKDGFGSMVDWMVEKWQSVVKGISATFSFGREVLDALGITTPSKSVGEKATAPLVMAPASSGSVSTPTSMPSSAEGMAKVIPLKQQQGVPASPTFTDFASQKPEQVSDPNIQALINEVAKLSQAMMQYAQAVSDRPINVAIEGDVKKLFRALNQEQKNQMGQRMSGGAF